MTAAGLRLAEARARLERNVADYAAAVLAAETCCRVKPYGQRRGRFEVTLPGGAVTMIGTIGEILAWHRENCTPQKRAAALREWLAVLGRQAPGT